MYGTLQPDGRSPKQTNGLASLSQLKPSSEKDQSSGTSFPSQTKGKKRERGDHSIDHVKRERSSRTDGICSGQHKTEYNVKSDIAKIFEKGGLLDFEGVEKLVQLIQPDRMEKKMDLNGRAMLAGVVAATEKIECLNWFMQLRGLSVFDEWLQEIHKGKIGGGNNSKDSDKSMEEFLLVLLCALDKVPVNLPALQTCNIGRSVNHLRSHKNVEIQRKARSLVDTWKKRVQEEMTSIDAETGSAQGGPVWTSKSRLPGASRADSSTPSGSDVAMKSSITQHSASKTTSVKSSHGHGENNTKSASSSPGPLKPSSPLTSFKESQPGTSVSGSGMPEVPLIREDRSSSSNQSHSYSPSTSTKEEKSSTAVSPSASKISSSSSRNRKGGGFSGVSGVNKDSSSSRSISSKKSCTSDKVSLAAFASERVLEAPVLEAGNTKLIVKISNRSRSPTQGVSSVSPEDPSATSSQASPPVLSDKLDRFDNNSKEKSDDTLQYSANSDVKVDSYQVNDRKDMLTGSDNRAGSAAVLNEEKSMSTEDSRRLMEGLEKNQLMYTKMQESSFSPMNALIESCVKYSEAHSSLSPEDDIGMNLLASVATGEMSRSELISPTDSTESTPATKEGICDDASEDQIQGTEKLQVCNDVEGDRKMHTLLNGSLSKDSLHVPKQESFSADMNCLPSHISADITAGERNKPSVSASEKIVDSDLNNEFQEEKVRSSNARVDITSFAGMEEKSGDFHLDTDKGTIMVEVACPKKSCNIDCKSVVNDGLNLGTNFVNKTTASAVKSELKNSGSNEKPQQTSHLSDVDHVVKVGERDVKDIKNFVSEIERDSIDSTVDRTAAPNGGIISDLCSAMDVDVEQKEIGEFISLPETGFPVPVGHEQHKTDIARGSKPAASEVDNIKSASNVAEACFAASRADPDAKVNFDLNEGFTVDDGKYGDPVSLLASVSTTVQMSSTLQFSPSPIPTLHTASVTVAAAAKGPFVPPEDLLRRKGELGWKGSAATSAFWPAEPRKVIEVPLASANFSCDASSNKNGHGMLDIDLNIDLNEPDEKVLEETTNDSLILLKRSGSVPVLGSDGLDFDLNKVDESNENGLCSTRWSHDEECSVVHVKSSGGLPYADVHRGFFDLNDRPRFDDGSVEHLTNAQHLKVAIPSQLPCAGPRTNNPGLGNLSSWFSPASTYSTVAIPSVIPDRTDQPFPVVQSGASHRTFGPAGISPFMPDVYRGSVLSSSTAVPFPSSSFQFPLFPYGHSFPLPSASFPIGGTSYVDATSGTRLFAPPVNSQLLGPATTMSTQFQRPFIVGLPDNSSCCGLENSRKWGRQGLDLNAGPGAVESDVKEDNLLHSSSQHSVANSQVQPEEQARQYQVSGHILKRSESDGGWDKGSFRYMPSSWQ